MVILHTEPRPFIANIQSAIHSTVKHLRDQTENAMEWNTSLRYMRSSTCITDVLHDEVSHADIANRRVTDEVVTACQSDKFPAAVVRSMPRIY